jgi:hypothetical protein
MSASNFLDSGIIASGVVSVKGEGGLDKGKFVPYNLSRVVMSLLNVGKGVTYDSIRSFY